MSVLSRPTRRHVTHQVTAPTQREARIPLQRTSPEPESPPLRTSPQTTQPAPMTDRRTRTIMVVGGGLAVALAIGVGTYAVLDDGGGSTVIAPSVSRVPTTADLGRDAAAAARNPDAGLPAVPQAVSGAEAAAAQAQRQRLSGDVVVSGGTSSISDATRLSEAQRDAAMARRANNFPS